MSDNDFVFPCSLEPERRKFPSPMASRRHKLRGPLIILIASIFAAPIGYYFSETTTSGVATSLWQRYRANRHVLVPRLRRASRDGHEENTRQQIASKGTEPSQPARSPEDAAVTMEQPSATGAQAAPASKGWGPPSEPLPAQMVTDSIVDVPPASTVQQEPRLATNRDDDRGTGAQSEIASKGTEPSQPARSPEDAAVTMEQPSATGAQAAPASKGTRVLDPEEIKLFMKQGEQFMTAGDVVAARTVFQRAAEAGDSYAAMALGATYDPTVLAKLRVVGIGADLEKARSWYQTAEKLGSPEARRRLDVLADR
jgi:hypothetical protein